MFGHLSKEVPHYLHPNPTERLKGGLRKTGGPRPSPPRHLLCLTPWLVAAEKKYKHAATDLAKTLKTDGET